MSKKAKTDQLRAAAGNSKSGPHVTKITAHRPSAAESDTKPPVELAVDNTGKTELTPVDPSDTELTAPDQEKTSSKSQPKLTRAEKKALRTERKAKKASARLAKHNEEERPLSTYFLLARPFVALGRYLRDSWREIRQVRWPNLKATWKMTLAVLVYCAIFMVFLLLLDALFTFVFDLLLKTN